MTVTVGEHEYLIGKLNVRQQFDIVRRLGIINFLFETELTDDHDPGARWLGTLLTGSLSQVPQVDMDFIINSCLPAVQRKNTQNKWAPAFNGAGLPQFEDIDMPQMLELVDCVLQDNLGPFYTKLRERRPETGDTTAAAGQDTPQPEC